MQFDDTPAAKEVAEDDNNLPQNNQSASEADDDFLESEEDGAGFGSSPFGDDKPISARPEDQNVAKNEEIGEAEDENQYPSLSDALESEDGAGFGGSPFGDDKPISARPEAQN